jgi:uncharacterized protein (TIGR02246 family)
LAAIRDDTLEAALDELALQGLVARWCREIDFNDGLEVAELFVEDCFVQAGPGLSYRGRDAMRAHYKRRADRIGAADGVRQSRHVATNLLIRPAGNDRATVDFVILFFTGGGPEPRAEGATPAMVTDVRMDCVREPGGAWRVAAFHGSPVFVSTALSAA